ncbi:hypothetical protein ACFWR9_32520 [Streptomyces sp. NPDC058534]|uniref:hypothetical protein n=1 Tax=Streptomyces sp. NPDC058534 TaxID=3346541 RepID=UPI003651F50A
MLASCQRPEVSVLLVEQEERLARFGTGVIRDVMLPAFEVELEVTGTDEDLEASRESELVRDMLTVVAAFSGRLCRQRSVKARALRKAVKSTVYRVDL